MIKKAILNLKAEYHMFWIEYHDRAANDNMYRGLNLETSYKHQVLAGQHFHKLNKITHQLLELDHSPEN